MSQTALRAEVLVEENAGGSQCRQPNSAPVGRTLGCDNIEIDAIKFYPPQQAQVTQSPGNFMPISLTPHLKRNKVVRYDLRYPGPLVVWWYCGLYKNLQDSTQPLVLVAFRKLMDSQSLSDEIVYQRIPLTALGQFRIGTVWEDGACWMSMSFESQVFDVDFTQHGWALTSFQRRHVLDLPPPYPSEIHPLHYGRDKNWLLEFSLETGGKLIVPCLEFFTRCYGRAAVRYTNCCANIEIAARPYRALHHQPPTFLTCWNINNRIYSLALGLVGESLPLGTCEKKGSPKGGPFSSLLIESSALCVRYTTGCDSPSTCVVYLYD